MSALRNSIIGYSAFAVLGALLGSGITAWVCWRKAVLSDAIALEVTVQRDMELLSGIEAGQSLATKRHLERFLAVELRMVNEMAKREGVPSAEARYVQRLVKTWRNRNADLNLGAELKIEIDKAISAIPYGT